MRGPSATPGSCAPRWRAAALATLVGLSAVACGGSGDEQELGAGATDETDAGAGAGGLVGDAVNDGEDDGGDESSTTTATEAPPSSDTTAAPGTTSAPPPTTTRVTSPPQTSPPQTSPPQTAAKPTPNRIDAGALGGDRRTIYDSLFSGLALEAGLNNSAQNHANSMAASGNSSASNNLYAETGFPWASVNEITAQGPDVNAVIGSLSNQSASFAGYSWVGVGVASGSNGVYVSIRVGRQ